MTFIITAASKSCVIQVADTLLSKNGMPYDDKLVKTTIVHCLNCRVAASCTGLGCLDGIRTDLWISRTLTRLRSWSLLFPDAVSALTTQLTASIARNPYLIANGGGLHIMLAGFGMLERGGHWPAIAVISNIEQPCPRRNTFKSVYPQREFRQYYFNQKKCFSSFFWIGGAIPDRFECNSFQRKIAKLLPNARTEASQTEVERLMVSMLRYHRRVGKLCGVIGANCTAVNIQPDLSSNSRYYSETHSSKSLRFPNLVREQGTIENLISPTPGDGRPFQRTL